MRLTAAVRLAWRIHRGHPANSGMAVHVYCVGRLAKPDEDAWQVEEFVSSNAWLDGARVVLALTAPRWYAGGARPRRCLLRDAQQAALSGLQDIP